jgi:hypothetical protein
VVGGQDERCVETRAGLKPACHPAEQPALMTGEYGAMCYTPPREFSRGHAQRI